MPLRRDIKLLDVKIITERLLLRPIDLIDLEPIAREFNEQITRYMYPPPARSRMDIAPFIAGAIEGLSNNTNLQMIAADKGNTDNFVGCVGLNDLHSPTPELGVWIAKSFHRQALGLEAIEALCNWVAIEIECDYLRYPVDRANTSSRRIPETLGG
ncbi:MAG: GNAT family N-acetyltransferase [Chloroflexi bacterium]|jgi:[ribosomal protein S5]-alanine N-acetyltransferase|nr:GNAT family N-acetyltransferase [Chloroflexota bacterium]